MVIEKKTIHVPEAMCEAYHYPLPSAFSRGMEVRLPGARMVFVSGTASVGREGESLHRGDFRSQARQAFENARAVLKSAGADWADVVKATIFIKDIKEHYMAFNEVRCAYFKEMGVREYPASTCIEATLCRDDLLVEMDMTAVVAL
ncbi:MAG: RidA family protein [Candidatus Eremiobacteraeota bacterium]|nr:RidA family protein [Candidatus Eremiobacteraeota bacterium]